MRTCLILDHNQFEFKIHFIANIIDVMAWTRKLLKIKKVYSKVKSYCIIKNLKILYWTFLTMIDQKMIAILDCIHVSLISINNSKVR